MLECSCQQCIQMCHYRPCFPTPKEAKALIQQGLAARLMLDWFTSDSIEGVVCLITPIIQGFEFQGHPSKENYTTCTFLDQNDQCDLHDKGLKPLGGRLVDHSNRQNAEVIASSIAKLWQSVPSFNTIDEFDALKSLKNES